MIYTIGHSTHTLSDFVFLLPAPVRLVVDVRSHPGSRRFPQWNKEMLIQTLPQYNLRYIHLPELGGRRYIKKENRIETAWHNLSFSYYAQYMTTSFFKAGIKKLLSFENDLVFMCAESVPWKCHRRLITDYLLSQKIRVKNILDTGIQEATLSSCAVLKDTRLSYPPTIEQISLF